jgi:hypothetical protein
MLSQFIFEEKRCNFRRSVAKRPYEQQKSFRITIGDNMEETVKHRGGYSDKEISDAIEQGAITKEYLADPQSIISSLNRLRFTEITSYLQYKQHAYMAVSLLSPGLKGEFESHAEQELTPCGSVSSAHPATWGSAAV